MVQPHAVDHHAGGQRVRRGAMSHSGKIQTAQPRRLRPRATRPERGRAAGRGELHTDLRLVDVATLQHDTSSGIAYRRFGLTTAICPGFCGGSCASLWRLSAFRFRAARAAHVVSGGISDEVFHGSSLWSRARCRFFGNELSSARVGTRLFRLGESPARDSAVQRGSNFIARLACLHYRANGRVESFCSLRLQRCGHERSAFKSMIDFEPGGALFGGRKAKSTSVKFACRRRTPPCDNNRPADTRVELVVVAAGAVRASGPRTPSPDPLHHFGEDLLAAAPSWSMLPLTT